MSAVRSTKVNLPTVLRRSARIAARMAAKNGQTVVPVQFQMLTFFRKLPAPVEKKPIANTPIAEKPTAVSDGDFFVPLKKEEITNRLRPLFAISNSSRTTMLEMCRVTTEVYTIIDQEFDFIRSPDFDPSGRFIKITERKCGELIHELQSQFSRGRIDNATYLATRQALAKVNKKFALLNSK